MSDYENSEKIDEHILRRPRLMTFESIAHSDDTILENRRELYEDFASARREMQNDAALIESSSSQRGRFLSI